MLLICYSGLPLSLSCGEKSCRRENKSLLTITYYFPQWFWSLCMVAFIDQWDPTDWHSISVRTPRITSFNSSPVFFLALKRDTQGLQDLFVRGLASPFDVSGSAASVLRVISLSILNILKSETERSSFLSLRWTWALIWMKLSSENSRPSLTIHFYVPHLKRRPSQVTTEY